MAVFREAADFWSDRGREKRTREKEKEEFGLPFSFFFLILFLFLAALNCLVKTYRQTHAWARHACRHLEEWREQVAFWIPRERRRLIGSKSKETKEEERVFPPEQKLS